MFKLPLKTRQYLRRLQPPKMLWRAAGCGLVQFLNAWMSTLNYRTVRYEREADPADELFAGPVIFVFWHEYIPFPVYTRPHCRLSMLVSQHQDAEALSQMARFAGLGAVRGSSSRGAAAAMREMIERGRGMSLAITPDGPRGPRRSLAQGCVYLSSRLQIPIVPLGIGYDRPWRNKSSWDKFAIPRPFSRCRAVLGPRIQIPENASRTEIESYRAFIEDKLTCVTDLAEGWAERKYEISGAEMLFRSPPRYRQRGKPQQAETAATPPCEGHAVALRVAG